jgi:SH3-like domain-containing protein
VKYRQGLILLPALAAASGLHAETLYVIEQVVVNVNSAPDSTGERVANIKSGDAVEVIERQNDQIHVHLANGTEGWVRKSYLSTEEPLQKRLSERTAEVDKLKQDVTRLEAEVAAGKATPAQRAAATAPNAHAAPPPSPAPASPAATDSTGAPAHGADETNSAEPAGAHEPPYFMTPPDSPAHPIWHWALGSFVVALGLGFVLGWQVLDRRIRRKYGGLRIY